MKQNATVGRSVRVSSFLVFCESLSLASLRCFVTFITTFARVTNLRSLYKLEFFLKSFRKLVNS